MNPSPGAGSPILSLRGLRKAFGAVRALDGASLEVARGEVHALVGENGAGKSTLLNLLGGAFAPDAGEMFLDGEAFRPSGPAAARRAGIALIHQELALAPHLSVEANVTLGLEASTLGLVRGRAARVREILDGLGYGHLDPAARLAGLGMAERQIVEIARALFQDARIILLDEPTSSLPAKDAERLFAVIRALRDRGRSLVYISHFLEEVAALSDRITVLRDGKTAAAGLPASTPRAEILAAMVGRPDTEMFPPRAAPADGPPEAPALSARDLVLFPGAAPISLELAPGRILGIAGLVGSGRSSLLRALAGLDPALAGEVATRSGTLPAAVLDPRRARALGLGFVSEDRKDEGLALNLSVRANATLATLRRFASRAGLLAPGREAAAVEDLGEKLRLRYAGVDQPVGRLSGGNQQKVALGRLLLDDLDVWLLDEPTRGVDVGAKAEIYRLAGEWASRGKAMLWAGSYLPELFGVCDLLAVMHRGRLGPVRPVSAWTPEAVMAYATSGRETP